jgi:hypothetical protein
MIDLIAEALTTITPHHTASDAAEWVVVPAVRTPSATLSLQDYFSYHGIDAVVTTFQSVPVISVRRNLLSHRSESIRVTSLATVKGPILPLPMDDDEIVFLDE